MFFSFFFSLKNNPLLFVGKVSPDKICIFLSSFWLQFATFIPVDFASPARKQRPKTFTYRRSFYRARHICVKSASATRESKNLLFHFVNESDIFGMRCKWPRDVIKVQIPGRRVFMYAPTNIMHTFYSLRSYHFYFYIFQRAPWKGTSDRIWKV